MVSMSVLVVLSLCTRAPISGTCKSPRHFDHIVDCFCVQLDLKFHPLNLSRSECTFCRPEGHQILLFRWRPTVSHVVCPSHTVRTNRGTACVLLRVLPFLLQWVCFLDVLSLSSLQFLLLFLIPLLLLHRSSHPHLLPDRSALAHVLSGSPPTVSLHVIVKFSVTSWNAKFVGVAAVGHGAMSQVVTHDAVQQGCLHGA